ncbi:MAG: hypothetical protein R3C20_09850 [Planctomycetaceae bacterium]
MLVILCLLNSVLVDDPVFSGPQPGETLAPFVMTGVFGKQADQKVDVPGDVSTPSVVVFVHERTRPALGVANLVMRLADARGPEKLSGSLVVLTDDPTDASTWMNRIPRYFPSKVQTGISVDGIEGPGAYGLNRNVALTVLVANRNVVTANFALVQPSVEVDGPKIFKAIAEVLGEKDVPAVADFMPQRRQSDAPAKRDGAMKRDEAMKRGDAANAAAAEHPQIRPLLGPLIQKTATDEQVVAAADKVEAFAAEHADFRVQVGDITRRIIAADMLARYGTPKCQEYLKKWSREFTDSRVKTGNQGRE